MYNYNATQLSYNITDTLVIEILGKIPRISIPSIIEIGIKKITKTQNNVYRKSRFTQLLTKL